MSFLTTPALISAPQAPALVTFGIPLLALIVASGFVAAQVLAAKRLREDPKRVAIRAFLLVAAWLLFSALLAAAGLLSRWDLRPPPMAPFFALVIGVGIATGLSSLGTRLARGLPFAMLVGFQAFRLPLELVMHEAARARVMPVEMSFSGYNFDIVTGATAVVVAALLAFGLAPRWLLVVWNAFGFLTLAVIAGVAFAATPLLHVFGTDPAHLNTWVAYFPFVWLAAVLVVAALAGHIVIARKLAATASLQGSELIGPSGWRAT